MSLVKKAFKCGPVAKFAVSKPDVLLKADPDPEYAPFRNRIPA
jgi:hypothetical protein